MLSTFSTPVTPQAISSKSHKMVFKMVAKDGWMVPTWYQGWSAWTTEHCSWVLSSILHSQGIMSQGVLQGCPWSKELTPPVKDLYMWMSSKLTGHFWPSWIFMAYLLLGQRKFQNMNESFILLLHYCFKHHIFSLFFSSKPKVNFEMTEAPANNLTATSWEALSQNRVAGQSQIPNLQKLCERTNVWAFFFNC